MLTDVWNHANYSVAEGKIGLLEECLDAIFPWEKYMRRPDILGYRLKENPRQGAIYFRPSGASGRVADAILRLRRSHGELDDALRELEGLAPDYNDHTGFMVESVAEWERRVALIERLAKERPDWQLAIFTYRPGTPSAMSSTVYQAFIRIGLLGPFRNTFEMQALQAT